MKSARKARSRQRGAAAVEFALVLPLLLLLALGGVDWGWYFYLRGVVASAAREGARAGSISWNQTTAENAATSHLSRLGLPSGRASATATPTNVNGAPAMRVIVTYPGSSLTGFTGTPANVQATAEMRRERF